MYAVIYLSRFSACYDSRHFTTAKRILRFLVTTSNLCLTYRRRPRSDGLHVVVYSDSDWASDKNDRRSFSGCAVFLNDCLISWCSCKQATIALSSTEAEYMALSDAGREVLYILNLLKQFFLVTQPVTINIDNKGAGYIGENDINNKRTKHIDVRYHFVRQHIKQKTMELFYVPTAANIADIFTKALAPEPFQKFMKMLLKPGHH